MALEIESWTSSTRVHVLEHSGRPSRLPIESLKFLATSEVLRLCLQSPPTSELVV